MIIELADLKAHLNLTTDTDDTLLAGKIAAAEQWVAIFIGADLAEDFQEVPAPILEAIRQLAAHLFENREASLVGLSAQELPFGLFDLLSPYRERVF